MLKECCTCIGKWQFIRQQSRENSDRYLQCVVNSNFAACKSILGESSSQSVSRSASRLDGLYVGIGTPWLTCIIPPNFFVLLSTSLSISMTAGTAKILRHSMQRNVFYSRLLHVFTTTLIRNKSWEEIRTHDNWIKCLFFDLSSKEFAENLIPGPYDLVNVKHVKNLVHFVLLEFCMIFKMKDNYTLIKIS